MNVKEKEQLETILNGNVWEVRPGLRKFLDEVKVSESETKPNRTGSQNAALHLWFSQIAEICQQQGVTWNMLIKHTVDVAVTQEGVKNFWKVLQKALYGTESTTELKKTGQIERMVDHFALFMGKEGVEIPPFPSNEFKAWEEIGGYKSNAGNSPVPYPEEEYKTPTF